MVLSRAPHRPCHVGSVRVLHAPGHHGHRVRSRATRWTRQRGGAIRAGRERAVAVAQRRPAHGRRLRLATRVRGAPGAGRDGAARPQDPAKRSAHRGSDGPHHQRHVRATDRERGRARFCPGRSVRRPRAGSTAAARQVRGVRVVSRAVPAGNAGSSCGRPPRRTDHGLGCAHRGRARVPRRLLGNRRRRARRRPRASTSGSVCAVSNTLGRRKGRGQGDPGQRADRHGVRWPRVLGQRPLHRTGAHLHRAERRR